MTSSRRSPRTSRRGSVTLAEAGAPLDPAQLVALDLPRAQPAPGDGGLLAHALLADGYGNVMLDAHDDDVVASGLRRGEPVTVNGRPARYGRTFADVGAGELLLYEDGYGALSLAVNGGSAQAALGLARDDTVHLAPGAPS